MFRFSCNSVKRRSIGVKDQKSVVPDTVPNFAISYHFIQYKSPKPLKTKFSILVYISAYMSKIALV